MSNKHKRWFHYVTCKFPLVSMPASWFLVPMYLIWILGSKLIRSNNQSRATLWVLETCLIVGLLPFIIILITASFVFKHTYNKASWCENWTFEGTRSTLSKTLITPRDWWRTWLLSQFTTGLPPFYHGSELYIQGLKQSDPTNREQESSFNLNPASKEMISDSVELCETVVCFLHIQLIGTNVWLPKTHNVPPEVDFESSRSPRKIGVLKQFQPCIVWQYYPHDNTVYIHMCDECKISSDSGVCHKLWSIS